jgi:excisionase family DNA binding protein
MADRLTVSQAADYIPCGISTLNKLRVSGGGPRFIKIGGRVLYDVRDLDKWLENCKRYSTSDQAA